MNDVQAATSLLNMTLSPMPNSTSMMFPGGTFATSTSNPSHQLAMLKVSGPDRVGIISGVSDWLFRHDINVESGLAKVLLSTRDEPYWAHGALYLLSADSAGMDHLRQALESDDLPVLDLPEDAEELEEDVRPPVRYQLDVLADDEPGILARISKTFARNKINIIAQSCDTDFACRGGASPGDPTRRRRGLFSLRMEVDVPRRRAREAIGRIQAEFNTYQSKRGWNVDFEERLTTARINRAISGIAGCDPRAFANLSQVDRGTDA